MSDINVNILYFAWMREHTGTQSESIALPKDAKTVRDLMPILVVRSPGHATALKDMAAVRVAVNRVYGDLSTPIAAGDEVAFFPPVTGG